MKVLLPQTRSHQQMKHHRQRLNIPFRKYFVNRQTSQYYLRCKIRCLPLRSHHFLVSLTEAGFLSIYTPHSPYNRSQMLLRLQPQTSATSWCKMGTTFGAIFTAMACNSAMTFVAILHTATKSEFQIYVVCQILLEAGQFGPRAASSRPLL